MDTAIVEMIEKDSRSAAQDFLNSKLELTTAEKVSKEFSDGLTTKDNRVRHLKALGDLMEQTFMDHKAEGDNQREEIDMYTQHCDKLLDELKEKTREMCDQFIWAPERYDIEKVTEEIEINMKEFEDISSEIQSKWDPDIETSKRLMEDEPFTPLEMPESSFAELRADTLDALIFNLDENIKEQCISIEQLQNEKITMEKEEEIYGH